MHVECVFYFLFWRAFSLVPVAHRSQPRRRRRETDEDARMPATDDCPFELNVERYNTGGQGYDHWPGGFFVEVLVHATPQHRFWSTEDLVVIDFTPHRYEIRHNACDENVDIFEKSAHSVTVEVKPTAAATINGPVGRFGCAINGLMDNEGIPPVSGSASCSAM